MPQNSVWEEHLLATLAQLDQAHLLRDKQVTQHTDDVTVDRNGQSLVNFGGNDYLGLRNHFQMVQAAIAATRSQGTGSGASPAVTGYSPAQYQLEQDLAEFCHHPAAIVFSSGFSANLAALSSLAGKDDAIFSDSLNHASLIDGCRLSRAERIVYPHADTQLLKQRLEADRARFQRVLIVTESIFSMDGDAAPLQDLVSIAQQFECGLVVDEAHATGVYGNTGGGLLEELSLDSKVLAKLGTLSKAIANVGGFACGSEALCNYLRNFGRSYMYSTALPGSCLAGACVALRLIRNMQPQRKTLRSTATKVRDRLQQQGWQVLGADSPIIPIVLGSEQAALAISTRLRNAGFFAPAIRPPTVPPGTSRIRISLSVAHTQQQIDDLLDAFSRCG
jgi:8-amino-7-oxononanoate synthase